MKIFVMTFFPELIFAALSRIFLDTAWILFFYDKFSL